ncbi:hypothetical protein [Epilithonimonas sp.]|uniref:hypothetical protein n=1 Tax=Epilithonimonas sp. TaxID=2894511 RepID=UPI00289D8908|nr:hypothetical protein [Epilithonimonas sp.]
MIKSSRIISLISYCFIILAGQMIGLPFICWILFTIFDFGNIDQIFAILAVIGFGLNFTKWKTNIKTTILSFFLMLAPIISRVSQVPTRMFNYLSFEIPLAIFLVGYLTFVILNAKHKKNYS